LWRPSSDDTVAGQWLFTTSDAPTRADLFDDWHGQHQTGSGSFLSWSHNTRHLDSQATGKVIGDGFRAEAGFIPQVGFKSVSAGGGWTVRPDGLVRRQRTFVDIERLIDRHGALIQQTADVGIGMDTRLGGFIQLKYLDDRYQTGGLVLPRRRVGYTVRFNPGRRLTQVQVDGTAGAEVDFTNSRPAHGATVNATATFVPNDRLELSIVGNRRWLDVSPQGASQRLLTATVERVRTTWSFNAHSFIRLIAQYVVTDRDPRLFVSDASKHDGTLTASALFAYKINWQSVLFVGYGDDREADATHSLRPVGQQVFVKVSYAYQR